MPSGGLHRGGISVWQFGYPEERLCGSVRGTILPSIRWMV